MSERIELDIPIPGTSLAVDRTGDPSAQTLVWLHGEYGALSGVPGRDALAEHLDVVEVHLPGFCVSPGGDRFDSIADLATATWWALDQLDVGRPVLAGHGLGAALAVEMAIQQASSVAGLALATPFGMFDTDDPGVDFFALMPRDLYPHLYADPASDLVLEHFPPPVDAHDRGLAAIRRVEVLGSTSRYLFPIPDTNVVGRAYRLADIPTTIWFGSADGVVPPSLAGAWSASLPHADVRTVDGMAHMLPYEDADFGAQLLDVARTKAAAS